MDKEQLEQFGPLASLVGVWLGSEGTDTAPGPARDRMETPFGERMRFLPVGLINNHEQSLYALRYRTTVWRLETQEVFHEELGYWLWDPENKQLMRAFTIPRGMSVLAGGAAEATARTFKLSAKLGAETYGITSSSFLDEKFKTESFECSMNIESDEVFSYEQDTVIRMQGVAELFHHTDRNRLKRVAGPHGL